MKGAGAGAGAAVAAVAVQAGWTLLRPSWARADKAGRARQVRWAAYLLAGGAAAATIGPWLVLVLLGCGLAELAGARARDGTARPAGKAVADGTTAGKTAAGGGGAGEDARDRGSAGASGRGRPGGGGGRRRGAGRGGLGGVQGGSAVVRRAS